jgi:Zn-dependent peptidase ImmA (M78 family)
MKIPKYLIACGVKHSIKQFEGSFYGDDGEELHGLFLPITREIMITNDLPTTVVQENVLHEFFHAILHQTGFTQDELSPIAEHIIVNSFAREILVNKKAILNLLRPNAKKSKV